MLNRPLSLPMVVGLLIGLALTSSAHGQQYPNRAITFVVPFAPGGLSDVPGRILAAEMQERIGQSIVVENKPGASGVTGATVVWRADPDGYTLLVSALADVQNLHYLPVPYDPVKDFSLIGMVTDGPPLVLIVNGKLPYKTVAELIADAKANPSKISFGTSGPATSPAIAVTQLNALAGPLQISQRLVGFRKRIRVIGFGAQVIHRPDVFNLLQQPQHGVDHRLDSFQLRHAGLGRVWIIPETRLAHLGFQRFQSDRFVG